MPMAKGTYLGGVRTLEDLRMRCRMDDEGCWVWGMGSSNGKPCVGVFLDGRHQSMQARRAAMILSDKGFDRNLSAWRSACCPNPMCINPAHTETGTASEMRRASNARIGATAQGQANARMRGKMGAEKFAKLTEGQVREIRHRRKHGETRESVAAAFGISVSNVSLITAHRTWRDTTARAVRGSSVFALG